MRSVSVIFILLLRSRSASTGLRTQPSRSDTAVQVPVPPLRLLVSDTDASRCRLPRTTRDLDALRAMAEANPLRGFPRLRRAAVSSAGRWEAASGAVMLQQKRECSRSFPEFSTAAQRLCSAAQQNPPLGFDAVSVRGRPTFVCVVRGCTRCRTAGS